MISIEKSKEGAIVVHGKYTLVVPKRGRKKKKKYNVFRKIHKIHIS